MTGRAGLKITIAAEAFDSPDARRLIAELDAELAEHYPPEQMFGRNLRQEQVESGLGMFVMARTNGSAIGCGALRMLEPGTAEVKRMYVQPEMRGRGAGREILDHLVGAATKLGARRLVLETGIHQAPAIGLYRRSGFRPIPCFGEYAHSPSSLCYERLL